MSGDEWLGVVQVAITKSGLPYRIVSCRCKRGSRTYFATIEHQRTKALHEVTLSPAIVPPEQMPNEIVRQVRAFNVDVPASCAKGHVSLLQFERAELRQLLVDGTLTLYCGICDQFREPTANDVVAVQRLLTEQPVG